MMRAALFALLVLAAACDPTDGREVAFRMRIETERVDDAPPGTFVTATGWRVELTEAVVVLGPVYLHENPPLRAFNQRPWLDRLGRLFIAPAFAHAGDNQFAGGAVLAEYLDQVAVDLLAPAGLDVGELVASGGRARSFSLWLEPPGAFGPVAGAPTRGFHAWVAGAATRDGERIEFEGGLELPPGQTRRVEGLAADVPFDADGGVLTLLVRPKAWFDLADFSTLTESADSGRTRITRDSQVGAVWYLGARGAGSYALRWETP